MREFIGVIAGLALVLCLTYPGFARSGATFQAETGQKPNFTGAWQPDPARSTVKRHAKDDPQKELPPPPPSDDDDEPSGPQTTKIQHKDPSISIMTTSPGAEDVSVLNLTTDGRENTNPVDEESTNKSKTHWDGDKLVTEWAVEQYGKVMYKGTDVRSLSKDGAEMIVDTRLETDEGIVELHQVFVRKPK